mmetsp:Transcript_27984/g.39340  ORF Transcript_27984/g.39340 Transcript_27984/m.39340 type:complete len:269 (+) Transcript_27984:204-1010(+)
MCFAPGFGLGFLSRQLLRRAFEVVELDEVAHPHLRWVVDNELVVAQGARATVLAALRQLRTSWLIDAVGPPGVVAPNAPGAGGALLRLLHVVSVVARKHVPQGHVAEEHVRRFPGSCSRVATGLGEHVREVDAFSEHVTTGRSFRRCHAEPLGQNADEVGSSGSMPHQSAISQVFESLLLALARNSVDGRDNIAMAVAFVAVRPLLSELLHDVPWLGDGWWRAGTCAAHVVHQQLELISVRLHLLESHPDCTLAVVHGVHLLCMVLRR